MLAEYDQYKAGFSDRVIEKINKESEHRHQLNNRDERRKDRSQIFGFVTALAGMGIAAATAILSDSYVVASIIAIVSVGGPSAANVLARVLDTSRSR